MCELFEVAHHLTVATLLVAVTADRRLTHLLGNRLLDDPVAAAPQPSQPGPLPLLGRDVDRIARRLPWHPRCLVQAVAAQRLLSHRGLPAVVHLAVLPGKDLAAHAWVSSQGRPVVGRRVLSLAHVQVASYALETPEAGCR